MVYWSNSVDYYMTEEIDLIKFQNPLHEHMGTLNPKMSSQVDLLKRHSAYIRDHISNLGESIIATRKIFNTSKLLKGDDQLPLRPITEVEALLTWFRFRNQKFDERVSGQASDILDEVKVIESIFVEPQWTKEQILLKIDTMECLKLDQIMEPNAINYNMDNDDYDWMIRYNGKLFFNFFIFQTNL